MIASRRTVLRGGLGTAALGAVALLSTACGQSTAAPASGASSAGGSLSITHAQGTTTVPKNPKKVFTFDFGTLDTLKELGVEVQGVPELKWPEPLKEYGSEKYTKIGASKEPDFEKIAAEKPDLIIISARAAKSYPEMSKIAPTLDLTVDTESPWESFSQRVRDLGAIFGKEKEAAAKLEALKKEAEGISAEAKKAGGTSLFLMSSAGTVTAYGSHSRFGFVYDLLGLTPVPGVQTKDAHGQAVSFEFLKEKNPARLYVLDRDAAIGQEKGGQSAKTILDNDLVNATTAAKIKKITYVEGGRWYLIGYGLGNLKSMFAEIRSGL